MKLLLIPLIVLACGIAQAGEVYKYRMPDGRILYTGKATPGARLLEVLPEPAPRRSVVDAEHQAQQQRERGKLLASATRRLANLEAVDAEVKAATKALGAAKADAEAGVEPLPGERLGMANGRSRLSESYWMRQRVLRQGLEGARERLDAAYEARDDLK